jgi:hypothetical protein
MTYIRRWGSPVKRPPRPTAAQPATEPNFIVLWEPEGLGMRHVPSGFEEREAFIGDSKSPAGHACLRRLQRRLWARLDEKRP